MIHLDFETRSEVDIWQAGAHQYSVHPSTEVLCLAYAIGTGPVRVITRDDLLSLELEGVEPQIEVLLAEVAKGTPIAAYNAFFERCIWSNIMEVKFGWPRVPIKQWRCVMAKALAHSLPQALAKSGAALNTLVEKDEGGRRVMLKLCSPRKDGSWWEKPEDMDRLYEYCARDVDAEREVDRMLPDLTPKEQSIWFLDQLINSRGVCVDMEAVTKALEFIEAFTIRLNDDVLNVSEGKLDRVTRREAVLSWCKDQGVDVPGYTKADVAEILKKNIPDRVRTVLETKLQLGKTSVKKYETMKVATGSDNRIRDLLIYHGAGTGRWAGKLVQLQNLPKGNVADTDTAIELLKASSLEDFEIFYPDVMGTLSSCIRGMFIAAPGKDLLAADFSAIEARVVMWLAGDKVGLKQFQDYDDGKAEEPYVEMARIIFKKREISKSERNLGKAIILGCGFGMGSPKFLNTCASWGMPISEGLAKQSVDTYRSVYRSVPVFWSNIEKTAIETVKTKEPHNCGNLRWVLEGDFLRCFLPSGRNISYHHPRIALKETPWGEKKETIFYMGENSQTHQWVELDTYGGKLTENVTQAVARDILAEALLRLEFSKYPVIFSVHDEAVCEVDEKFGSVEEFVSIMETKPLWAVGCPVKAAGWRGKRYKK